MIVADISDAAVASIVTGVVTITTIVVGFLTLWMKLKYGVGKAEEAAVKASEVEVKIDKAATNAKVVENKIDANTSITSEAKDAANKAVEHAEACDSERVVLLKKIADHDTRITSLESQMAALKISVDGVTKNVDSTRHEMRGHLQAITNKLDIISMLSRSNTPVQVTVSDIPAKTEEQK